MTRTDPALPDVAHDPAAHRFSLAVDGHQAVLDYLLRDGAMVITIWCQRVTSYFCCEAA